MLHCPRCSGPLEVKAVKENTNRTELRTTECPAGHQCPHSRLTHDNRKQDVSINRNTNYLSGGCVFMDMATPFSSSVTTSTAAAAASNRSQFTSSSLGQHQQRQHHQSNCTNSNPSFLNLPAVQESPIFLATTLASIESIPHHHHQQQQHQQQLLQQQQQRHMVMTPSSPNQHPQMISQPFPQQFFWTTNQPQPQQQQQVIVTSTPFGILHQTAAAAGASVAAATPVFLTSTINNSQGFEHHTSISTQCQPQTPAIVVGSSGSPFFSQNFPPMTLFNSQTQQQQQQQQPVTVNFPVFTQPPNIPMPVAATTTNVPCVDTYEVLVKNKLELEQCEWYHPNMRWNESSDLLQNRKPGTFLVRDSADQKFLFSLSVQRSEGPTSVRIHFKHNKFSLDAEDSIRELMPKFDTVIALIDYYCSFTANRDNTANNNNKKMKSVWIDSHQSTCKPQVTSPISLRQPCYKHPPSLAHWCRLTINKKLVENKSMARKNELNLPSALVTYLNQYPHKV